MAHKGIKCTKCHTWKARRSEKKPKNPQSYICLNCRYYLLSRDYMRQIISNSKQYREIKKEVLREVNNFENNTTVPIAFRQQSFVNNVKQIMAQKFIRDYKFNIIDNKLRSISLLNLPFIGQVDIPIYEEKK